MPSGKVWTTLLSKVYYIQATIVLDQSLKDVHSRYPLVVMVVPDLPNTIHNILRARNIQTRPIEYLKPEEGRHTVTTHDERFKETWGKLRCFDLDEYEVCILR